MHVLAGRADRLGCRLVSILGGYRIARKYGYDFNFHWEKGPQGKPSKSIEPEEDLSRPELIFSDEFIKKYWLPKTEVEALARTLPQAAILSGETFSFIKPDGYMLCDKTTHLSYHPDDVKVEADKEIRSLIRTDNIFRKDLVDKINNKLNSLNDSSSRNIAIHVRRGDALTLLARSDQKFIYACRVAPLSFYLHTFARIKTENVRVFIFSDDEGVKKDLRKALKKENVQSIDFNDVTDLLQQAFCDLLLMSSMDSIISTASAFNVAANIIGGGKLYNVHDMDIDVRIKLLKAELKKFRHSADEHRMCVILMEDALVSKGEKKAYIKLNKYKKKIKPTLHHLIREADNRHKIGMHKESRALYEQCFDEYEFVHKQIFPQIILFKHFITYIKNLIDTGNPALARKHLMKYSEKFLYSAQAIRNLPANLQYTLVNQLFKIALYEQCSVILNSMEKNILGRNEYIKLAAIAIYNFDDEEFMKYIPLINDRPDYLWFCTKVAKQTNNRIALDYLYSQFVANKDELIRDHEKIFPLLQEKFRLVGKSA
jgi:hypothetical protein